MSNLSPLQIAESAAADRFRAEREQIKRAVLAFHVKSLEWRADAISIDVGYEHAIAHCTSDDGKAATYAYAADSIKWLGNLTDETRDQLRETMRHRSALKLYEIMVSDSVRATADAMLAAGLPLRTVGAALGVSAQYIHKITRPDA